MFFSQNQLKVNYKSSFKPKSKRQIPNCHEHSIQAKHEFYSFANKTQIENQNQFGDQTKNYSLIKAKLNPTSNIDDASFNGSIDMLNFSKELSEFASLNKQISCKTKTCRRSPGFCSNASKNERFSKSLKLLLLMIQGLTKQKQQLELDIGKFIQNQTQYAKILASKIKQQQIAHANQLVRLKLQKQKLYNQNEKLSKLLLSHQNQFQSLKNSIIDKNKKNELLQKLLASKVEKENNQLDQLILVKKQLLKQTQHNRQLMIDNLNLKQNIFTAQQNFKKLEKQQSKFRKIKFDSLLNIKYDLKESSHTQKTTLFDSRETIKLRHLQRECSQRKLDDYGYQELSNSKVSTKQNKLQNTLTRVKSMILRMSNEDTFNPIQKQKQNIEKMQHTTFV